MEEQHNEFDKAMEVAERAQGTGVNYARPGLDNNEQGSNSSMVEIEEVFQFSASQESIKAGLGPLRRPKQKSSWGRKG